MSAGPEANESNTTTRQDLAGFGAGRLSIAVRMSTTTHRALRLALASLLAVALASQYIIGSTDSGLTAINFFSYFNVLSNTAAVVALTLLAIRPQCDSSLRFAIFRGAVTVYMAVTGLLYVTILYTQLADVGVPEPWIDLSIHVIGPVLVTADWLYDSPPIALPRQAMAIWLVFPAVYVVYALVRGPIADWYPYPFLDPEESGGYGPVKIRSAIVLVVILGFSSVFYWWSNHRLTEPAPA